MLSMDVDVDGRLSACPGIHGCHDDCCGTLNRKLTQHKQKQLVVQSPETKHGSSEDRVDVDLKFAVTFIGCKMKTFAIVCFFSPSLLSLTPALSFSAPLHLANRQRRHIYVHK